MLTIESSPIDDNNTLRVMDSLCERLPAKGGIVSHGNNLWLIVLSAIVLASLYRREISER